MSDWDDLTAAAIAGKLSRRDFLLRASALGATAAKYLLGLNDSMANLRGRFYDFTPHAASASVKLAVTYHPAYLLRDPRQKAEAWKDLQMVMGELGLKPPKKS